MDFFATNPHSGKMVIVSLSVQHIKVQSTVVDAEE